MKRLIVLMLLVLLAGCQSNQTNALVPSDTAELGQILTFPKGYHLVSFAIYNTDMITKTTYVCQSDDDLTIYRICIPKTG